MKLEKQVASLALSQRLKELGVKQESLFYWRLPEKGWLDAFARVNPAWEADGMMDGFEKPTLDYYGLDNNPDVVWGIYGASVPYVSAFTVAELGEMLPKNYEFQFFVGDSGMGELWHLTGCKSDLSLEGMAEETEADARAQMLIYLIENKLITV